MENGPAMPDVRLQSSGDTLNVPPTAPDAIAIPVATVLAFVERALHSKPGVLGITFQPVRVPQAVAASYEVDDEAALMLTAIEPGSAAEAAGLFPGDIILRAGQGRRGLRHLARALRNVRAGDPFPLELLRAGRLVDVQPTPSAQGEQ